MPTVRSAVRRMRAVATSARSMRCCGSCACNLTSVACGRLDAFYEIGFGGCWDVAAGATKQNQGCSFMPLQLLKESPLQNGPTQGAPSFDKA
eukprot:365661-Chlamydomonas_euryale.AAC.30